MGSGMSSSAANWSASRSCACQAALTAAAALGRPALRVQYEVADLVSDGEPAALLGGLAAQHDGVAVADRLERRLADERLAGGLDDLEVERAHDVTQRDRLTSDAGALQQARGLPADVGGRVAHQVPRSEYYHRVRTRTPSTLPAPASSAARPSAPPGSPSRRRAGQPSSGRRRAITPPTSSAIPMVPAQMRAVRRHPSSRPSTAIVATQGM